MAVMTVFMYLAFQFLQAFFQMKEGILEMEDKLN
jgi:hypothetical protein